MRCTVLVLNRRYVPHAVDAPYMYGVVQHALRVAKILTARGHRIGFVLYERDERLSAPRLRAGRVLGSFDAVIVNFHFGMRADQLTTAFAMAVHAVVNPWKERRPPLIYYQTSAVLAFAPPEFDSLVTHHGPFVHDVIDALGEELAAEAFEGDHVKMEHLRRAQLHGMAVARSRERILCAEISPIQVERLQREGIPHERVLRIPQPVDCQRQYGTPLPDPLSRVAESDGPVAIIAVSRLDQFKNVELFVRGCCLALESADLTAALVVGGFPHDAERQRLQRLVPPPLRAAFHFAPRVSHGVLAGNLFYRLAGRGIFVCSSRFDLVPYTALEAARAGLCTIVADLPTVGARDYIPQPFRFPAHPEGLAAAVKRVAPRVREFDCVGRAIRHATSDEAFLDGFGSLCSRFAAACSPTCGSRDGRARARRPG
jgi:glycosyltransferase involved in cell wall biosynthesis